MSNFQIEGMLCNYLYDNQAFTLRHTCTHTSTYTHARTRTDIYIRLHSRIRLLKFANTLKNIQANACTQVISRTHKHICIYME